MGAALEWRVDEFTQASGVQATIQIEGLERRLLRDIEVAHSAILCEQIMKKTNTPKANVILLK